MKRVEKYNACRMAIMAFLIWGGVLLAGTYSVDAATGEGWLYDEETKTLTVTKQDAINPSSATSELYENFTTSFSHYSIKFEELEHVVLAESELFTIIPDNAFAYCGNLKDIEIPDTITTIGSGAFLSCTSLEEATVPDSVTSIGNSAFNSCESLRTISLSENITTISESCFAYCEALAEINIPIGVTSIENSAFSYVGLTSIEIPSGITSIGNSAFDNSQVTSVSIPDTVTSIGDSAFYNSNLKSIDIPDSVTTISNKAFANCTSLVSVVLPDSVNSIGEGAFKGCSDLTNIQIEVTSTDNAKACIKQLIDSGASTLSGTSTNDLLQVQFTLSLSEDSEMTREKINEVLTYMVDECEVSHEKIRTTQVIGEAVGVQTTQTRKIKTDSSTISYVPTKQEIYLKEALYNTANAKEGDTVILDGRDAGIFSYNLAFMKAITKNRKATIIMRHRYNGVEFEVTILPGGEITLDESIPWFGPLYIYSGALGKNVKVTTDKPVQ